MYDQVLILIGVTETIDDYGDPVKARTHREVLARLDRVYLSEAIQGQAQGFKPEHRFTLSDYYDYEGEQEVIHDGIRYKVLSTMRKGTELELVVYGGVHLAQA